MTKAVDVFVLLGDQLAEQDVAACLGQLGHRIWAVARSAEQATELARNAAGGKQPDLMLIDVVGACSPETAEALAALVPILGLPTVYVARHIEELEQPWAAAGLRASTITCLLDAEELAPAIQLALRRARPAWPLVPQASATERAPGRDHTSLVKIAMLTEAEIRPILDNLDDGFYILDREWRYVYINRRAAELARHTPDELLGQNIWELFHPAADALRNYPVIARAIAEQAPVHLESHYPTYDLWYELSVYPADRTTSFLVRDVTERKRTERQIEQLNADLRRRAAELEAANAELETFSYSVSHDLRAPLRSINGFSRMLLEDYAAVLDARGQDYLRRVHQASERMATLIDDLLDLSRMVRTELKIEPCDLSAMAQAVVGELRKGQPERDAAVTIAPGLQVHADPTLLQAVLENLLGNAWKFTAKVTHARIELGSTERDGRTAYFVRDNGAGFDMAYADKLFAPFQRLHDSREFEGTGIGLATVKRILLRHGGQIWAEAAPGAGATFTFTLST